MILSYATLISPDNIDLSIGTVRKPKLKDISKITFEKFDTYEFFLLLTPEMFFNKLVGENKEGYWGSFSVEEQQITNMYDIVLADENLQRVYVEIFNFFFVEQVIFKEGVFILLSQGVDTSTEIDSIDHVRGVIHKEVFAQVLEVLQQICCIYKEKDESKKVKYKNKLAEKLHKRMLAAAEKEKKKFDKNLTVPNIISTLSCNHPSINYINIWELTLFQLFDNFERLQLRFVYEIDSTRVSVWGDEKKTFDAALWYKNNYDKHELT